MRKFFTLTFVAFLVPLTGSSQTTTETLPNGVLVHQANGVANTPVQSLEIPKMRTMEDWSLAECVDALRAVEIKLNEASDEDRPYYEGEKEKLVARIALLKNVN